MSSLPGTPIAPLTFSAGSPTEPARIGAVSLQALAAEYGTPLYILDELTIRERMRDYKTAFRDYPAAVQILYAAKANLCMGLCPLIRQEGLGMDVVSGGEYYTALQAGFPPEEIVFNGNNKTQSELELAIGSGIGKISVDNEEELALIHRIAKRGGKRIPVLLRITPGIECHTHDYIQTGHLSSKFGFPLPSISRVIEAILSDYHETLDLIGLHAHIGSQIFEIRPYEDLVERMLNLYYNIRQHYGITLTHLNLGGGLGVCYQPEDDPPSLAEYAEAIIRKLVDYAALIDFPLPTLMLEPGRSLIATAGVTLYTVGSVKTIPDSGMIYVALDGGMGDNIRPALYGAKYSAMLLDKQPEPNTKMVALAGRYCESGDILMKELQVPESVAPGDLLLVFGTGAYNYSMFSTYNRVPRPAMVLVAGEKVEVMVERQTLDDLLSHDLIPDSLRSCLSPAAPHSNQPGIGSGQVADL